MNVVLKFTKVDCKTLDVFVYDEFGKERLNYCSKNLDAVTFDGKSLKVTFKGKGAGQVQVSIDFETYTAEADMPKLTTKAIPSSVNVKTLFPDYSSKKRKFFI